MSTGSALVNAQIFSSFMLYTTANNHESHYLMIYVGNEH